MNILYYYNLNKKVINHPLCDICNKNNISCLDGDEVCLPLEMFIQLCSEKSTLGKLEMVDNVMEYLDLG